MEIVLLLVELLLLVVVLLGLLVDLLLEVFQLGRAGLHLLLALGEVPLLLRDQRLLLLQSSHLLLVFGLPVAQLTDARLEVAEDVQHRVGTD